VRFYGTLSGEERLDLFPDLGLDALEQEITSIFAIDMPTSILSLPSSC
jgi:hypothetical protein